MRSEHVPVVDARYWAAILAASVLGTNLGDLYAHGSGLGIGWGVLLLAALAALAFVAERVDRLRHEAWYWTAIIVIRTGATNIADYLAFGVRIPQFLLVIGLAALIASFGWMARARSDWGGPSSLDTGASYWTAMLSAGVFGTVLGDVCSHVVGEFAASLFLLALLAAALALRGRAILPAVASYWLVVAVARTAGTAVGDWLAENPHLSIGLPLATTISAVSFVLILTAWPRRRFASTASIELR